MYFDEVKYFLENNDFNETTQKKLEIMGIDYNLIKKNNLTENKPLFELIENKQIKLLFIEVDKDLKSKIKVLKMKDEHSKYFDKLIIVNFSKINKNSKQKIMCSKLYSELDHDKTISILLGNALDIINNPSIENNFSTKVFIRIARKLINYYFNLLFDKEKKLRIKNKIDCSDY
jgi:hypothetical protein